MWVMIDIPEECIENISNAFKHNEEITKHTVDLILDGVTKGKIIPNDATNGDTVVSIFPNAEVICEKFGEMYVLMNGFETSFDSAWWKEAFGSNTSSQADETNK